MSSRAWDLPDCDKEQGWAEEQVYACRQEHLNKMVNTAGVVTRRTNVFPQLQQVKFDCMKCGYVLGPFFQHAEGEVKPNSCPQCQGKGPFTVRPLSRPCSPVLP